MLTDTSVITFLMFGMAIIVIDNIMLIYEDKSLFFSTGNNFSFCDKFKGYKLSKGVKEKN